MSDKKTVDETGKKMHELVHFEYNGVTYQARKKVDPKVADLIQRGNTLIALERMIGKEPYAKFLDSIDDMDEVNEIYMAFNKAADSGKLLTLGWLLREHRTALDFDLRRYCRFDLDDLPDSDFGRVAGWVDNFPPDSATARAQGALNESAADVMAGVWSQLRNANLQRAGENITDADILYPGYRVAPSSEPVGIKSHLDRIHRKRAQELAAMTTESG